MPLPIEADSGDRVKTRDRHAIQSIKDSLSPERSNGNRIRERGLVHLHAMPLEPEVQPLTCDRGWTQFI